MYLTALYCVLYARNKLGINNSDIPVLEKDVMYQLIQTCQAKDGVNLVKVTINKLFSKTKELTYEPMNHIYLCLIKKRTQWDG